MSDPEWLAEIKGRGRRGRTILQWQGDLDRLILEVEGLTDENHLLNGFAADHGHDRCIAEIRRLREELIDARLAGGQDFTRARREAERELREGKTHALNDVVTELED